MTITDAMIWAAAEVIRFSPDGLGARELARRALEAAERAAWRPIEEAPKDGTRIQMFPGPWGKVSIGQWADDRYARKPRPYWSFDDDLGRISYSREAKPTHFRPLPTPGEPDER